MDRGYKHCTSPHHEGKTWLPVFNFHVHTRNEDGSIRLLQSWCKTCQRIDQRIRVGIKRRGKPFQARKESKSGYKQRNPAERRKYLARRRRRYKKMTAEQRENKRERERIAAEGRRRKEGVKRRSFENRKTVVKSMHSAIASGEEMYPTGPIKGWLHEKKITAIPGISDSVVTKIRNAEDDQLVSLDLIDRMLTGMEEPWMSHQLYPLEGSDTLYPE